MATIMLDNFGGIAPRLHPTLLGANMAVKAHNCLLKSGKLVPIRQPSKANQIQVKYELGMTSISHAKSLYVWHKSDGTRVMLAWPTKVTVAESNLSVDPKSRLFVSGETRIGGDGENGNHPGVYIETDTGDGINRHDIVKESLPAPDVWLYNPDDPNDKEFQPADPDNVRYTFFFQTWVDKYGYESGVSEPSREIEYNDGDAIMIAALSAPSGAVKRRIYKVVAGTESDNVQFVWEQNVLSGGETFLRSTFKVLDEDAGEVIPTLQSASTDLEMICKVPNGFYAGVRRGNNREVRFSESGNPTIWPDAYTASVFDDIVGLGVTLNTVFVLTKGKPWAITGVSPDSMSAAILASAQGCVSADSICTYNGAVFYASPDGICMLQDSSAAVSVITEQMFSRREWQKLRPETCRMVAHDAELYCFFIHDDSTVGRALVIHLTDNSSAAVTTHDEVAKCVAVDVETDEMFFVRSV